jgi:uncharacterized protein (DUF2252 family)
VHSVEVPVFPSEAHRIVTAQHFSQAVTPALLAPVTCGGRAFVLRELQPAEDRLVLDSASGHPRRLARAVVTMGQVAAWMHLRAAGRHGAPGPDALVEWAANHDAWPRPVMHYAARSAARVTRDWTAFAHAYDHGAIPRAPDIPHPV